MTQEAPRGQTEEEYWQGVVTNFMLKLESAPPEARAEIYAYYLLHPDLAAQDETGLRDMVIHYFHSQQENNG